MTSQVQGVLTLVLQSSGGNGSPPHSGSAKLWWALTKSKLMLEGVEKGIVSLLVHDIIKVKQCDAEPN